MKQKKIGAKAFYFLAFITALSLVFTGCKKNNDSDDNDNKASGNKAPATGTRAQLTKDSIFLYAKEVYLWNEELPSYEEFNPRRYNQFPDELENYNNELFDITQTTINPTTGKPFEFVSATATYPKYSNITDEESNNPSKGSNIPSVSQVSLEGVGTDFGIALAAVGPESDYQVYLRFVSPGSAAARNQLRRGDRILEINGRTLGGSFTSDQDYIEGAFERPSLRLRGIRPDGSEFTRTITKVTYNSSPVYRDTVIAAGGRKIGYLAFARFSNPENATGPLNQSFTKFASAGVTELVIDFRYNGGGYVTTAEHLANLIAPAGISGSVMFTEHFNETLRTGKATILRNQLLLDAEGSPEYTDGRPATYYDISYSVEENTVRFQKAGSLNNINKVVFIVSENSASASELVINGRSEPCFLRITKITCYVVGYSNIRSKSGIIASLAPRVPALEH